MSIFQPLKVAQAHGPVRHQRLLCFEGLIGAGKTTLLSMLQRKADFYFITEPVLQWQKQIDSESLLGNLYQDFDRWSYTFQVNSVLTRAQAIEQEKHLSRGRHLVMERSLLSDRECFARLYFDSGQMSALEWYWYGRYYDYVNLTVKHPDAFIYLRVAPETALRRIHSRKRTEENSIALGYLQDLHRRYEALFGGGDIESIRGTTPVLVIDGEADLEHDAASFENLAQSILSFLQRQNFDGVVSAQSSSRTLSTSGP